MKRTTGIQSVTLCVDALLFVGFIVDSVNCVSTTVVTVHFGFFERPPLADVSNET
jgi:hypothetical protein